MGKGWSSVQVLQEAEAKMGLDIQEIDWGNSCEGETSRRRQGEHADWPLKKEKGKEGSLGGRSLRLS